MSAQPVREIGGLVMRVRLPLECLTASGEEVAGAGDEVVEVVAAQAAEVAVADETPIHAGAAEQWTVPLALHSGGLATGERGSDLGVVGIEQRVARRHERHLVGSPGRPHTELDLGELGRSGRRHGADRGGAAAELGEPLDLAGAE